MKQQQQKKKNKKIKDCRNNLKKSDNVKWRPLQILTNDNNQLRKRSELQYVTILASNFYSPQFINFGALVLQ